MTIFNRFNESEKEVYKEGMIALRLLARLKGKSEEEADPKIYNDLREAWRSNDIVGLCIARSDAKLECERACC